MLSTTHFQMSYDDFYGNRSEVVQDILAKSQFLDVTIVNEEREWGAHRLILSSASPVLRRILNRGNQMQSLVYLRGTKSSTIEALLNFIYQGEAAVPVSDVNEFVNLGKELKLTGIHEDRMKVCDTNGKFEQANMNLGTEDKPVENEGAEAEDSNRSLIEASNSLIEASNRSLMKMETGIEDEKAETTVEEKVIENNEDGAEAVVKRKRGTKSPVWMCCTQLTSSEAKCNICDKVLRTPLGTTSNLIGHIRSQHSTNQLAIEMEKKFCEMNKNIQTGKIKKCSAAETRVLNLTN